MEGERVVYVPAAVAYHRHHGSGLDEDRRVALLEANALASVVKNYENERSIRVLHCALALLGERARLAPDPARRRACTEGLVAAIDGLPGAERRRAELHERRRRSDAEVAPLFGIRGSPRSRARNTRGASASSRRFSVRRSLSGRERGRGPNGGGVKLTRRAALGLGAGALAAGSRPRALTSSASEASEPSGAPAGGASAASPDAGAPGDPAQDERTAEYLHELILRRAVPMHDAWIEMHVVLALGGTFDRDGKNLLDDLVSETLAVDTSGLRQYPYFPLTAERHPFHVLQIMQAVGVPEDRVFVTPVGRYSRRELIEGGAALLEPKEIHDELSWVVSVLCSEFPPDRDRFTTARGTEVVVADVVRQHLREAETSYADVFAVMEGKKLYQKSAIHSTACNGTHLLYGLIDALATATAPTICRRTSRSSSRRRSSARVSSRC